MKSNDRGRYDGMCFSKILEAIFDKEFNLNSDFKCYENLKKH